MQGRKGLTVPIRFNNRQEAPYLEDCSLCAVPNLSLNLVRKREELSGAEAAKCKRELTDWQPDATGKDKRAVGGE